MRDLQPFERIEAQFDHVRIEAEPLGPLAGHGSHAVQHHLGHAGIDVAGQLLGSSLARERGAGAAATAGAGTAGAGGSAGGPGEPIGDRGQGFLQEGVAAGVPLDLSARRLGHGTETHENDAVGGQLVLERHIAPDGLDHIRPVLMASALDFADDDQALPAVQIDGESRRRAGLQFGAGPLDRQFDVLRIAIDTPDDDQVLEAPRHEQLASVQETEIARAQESATGLPGDLRVEQLCGRFRLVPVALRDTGAADPDFAHLMIGQPLEALRIDDRHLFIRQHVTAADDPADAGLVRLRIHDPVLVERFAVERAHHGRVLFVAAGDDQRGFRHPVAGEERLLPKTDGGEPRGETLQRRRANRLRPIERDVPRT